MTGSAIIEVAIGMIFVFSLLSILVTTVNSLIVSVFNLRAKSLKRGVEALITDKVLCAQFMCHPLIRLIDYPMEAGQQCTPEMADEIAKQSPTKVDNIDPKKFVSVFKDVLAVARQDEQHTSRLYEAINDLPPSSEKSMLLNLARQLGSSEAKLLEFHRILASIKDETRKKRILEALVQVQQSLDDYPLASVELVNLIRGARALNDRVFSEVLDTILEASKTIQEAEARLEAWFNNAIAQVSTLYGQRLQYVSLAIGLLLAIALNVDSLALGRTLWEDPALREGVAAAAESAARTTAVTDEQTDAASPGAPAEEGTLGDVVEAAEETQRALGDLLNLRLPLGWQWVSLDDEEQLIGEQEQLSVDPFNNPRNLWNLIPGNSPRWWSLWLQKIAGWAITTFAIAQGAPFWFNLLNRITGARRGGSAEAESGGSSSQS